MAESVTEKRKSINNSKAEILEARVVANYGDPGLDENYHFDILSRYVIVMIESAYRVPTADKWSRMLAVVKRPEHLHISCDGGRASSPNYQRRADSLGNITVGAAGSLSVAGIPRMNNTYQLGELIKIKKLSTPLRLEDTTFFMSEFPDAQFTYEPWHSEGSTLPYFSGSQERADFLRAKTIFQPDTSLPLRYGVTLYKYQYEAFMLNLTLGNENLSTYLTSIFANVTPSSNAVYHGHGGYVFKTDSYINFYSCDYEDINAGNKQRVLTNECVPLIVTTPNSFPTPKTRSVGTISYNPTYATIAKQN
jgi:hypothetical protein